MKNTLYRIVARDMTEQLQKEYKYEERFTHVGKVTEVWVYNFDRVFNKESRRLNKLLGVNTLNYQGNTNGFGNKKNK